MGLDNLLEYIDTQFPNVFDICKEDDVHRHATAMNEHIYPYEDVFQTFLTTQLASHNAYFMRDRQINVDKRVKVRNKKNANALKKSKQSKYT